MSLLDSLQTTWQGLALRERRLVGAAILLVGAALLWWIALAPALATLRTANAQHKDLDGQLQRMLVLKAQTTALQGQTRAGAEDARTALDTSVKQAFGVSAAVQVTADRATVTLKAASADALAAWLVDVRNNARLMPAEARLTRAGTPDRWDGTLVLSLPPR